MNFEECVKIANITKRNDKIESQVYEESWGDYLAAQDEIGESCLRYGGWPTDEEVERITITDEDKTIEVLVELSFYESVASSCKDYNHDYPGWATFKVTIFKEDGYHDVENLESSAGEEFDEDEMEVHPDDFL